MSCCTRASSLRPWWAPSDDSRPSIKRRVVPDCSSVYRVRSRVSACVALVGRRTPGYRAWYFASMSEKSSGGGAFSSSGRRDERPSRRSDWVRPVAGRDGRGMVRRGALLAGATPWQSTRSRPSRGRGLHGRDVASGSDPAAAPRHRCVGRLAVCSSRVLRRLRVPGGSHRESRRMGAARRDGARTTGRRTSPRSFSRRLSMAIFRRPAATLRVPRTAS